MEIDGKKFDCPLKYLNYNLQNSNQEYAPHSKLIELQEQTVARQLESKNIDKDISKEQNQESSKEMDFEK